MREGNLTILCTGDIHLGRRPSRIPKALAGRKFSPKAVWRSTVEEAISRDVDAVAITGDIVDRENRYFEAYGAFEEGALQLDNAGIPIVTVAGNHDFDVFPRMADDLELESLVLLGEGGSWDRWTLYNEGEPQVHFDGWSFPNEHVLTSPLDTYNLSKESKGPMIGLLHGDLGTRESQYAPVQMSELTETHADAWLLGHIHKPTLHEERDPLILYPGSPQALDPGERDTHGPWVLTLNRSGVVDAEQLPLASVRYDRIEVDVSGAIDPKDVPPMISDRVDQHIRTEVNTGALELLLARVQLIGRTDAHGELVNQKESIEDQLSLRKGSIEMRAESLEINTKPEVDLEKLASGETPVAYVADLILSLEDGNVSNDQIRLVENATNALREAHGTTAYRHLRSEGELTPPAEENAVELLQQQATLVLDTLLQQKEGRL